MCRSRVVSGWRAGRTGNIRRVAERSIRHNLAVNTGNPWVGRPAGTIQIFHAFPSDIEGTQAEFHISAPSPDEPNAAWVPVILRHEDGRALVIIYDHGGAEIWKLDLAQFQAALDKGANLITP